MSVGCRVAAPAEDNADVLLRDADTAMYQAKEAGKDRVEIFSDATPLGSLQVPGSGQPILLMADRQTTGGYPKIASVITADVPVAGQLAPGDWIRFVPWTRADALDALNRLERRLAGQLS